MKRIVLAFLASAMFSQSVMAEMGPESIYPLMCGTREEVIAAIGGTEPTQDEWNELIQQRVGVLQTLSTPKESIKKAIEDGSKNDTGFFGVLVVCGVIMQLSPQVEEKGCVDLQTNRVIRDQGAVALCKSVMDRIGNK